MGITTAPGTRRPTACATVLLPAPGTPTTAIIQRLSAASSMRVAMARGSVDFVMACPFRPGHPVRDAITARAGARAMHLQLGYDHDVFAGRCKRQRAGADSPAEKGGLARRGRAQANRVRGPGCENRRGSDPGDSGTVGRASCARGDTPRPLFREVRPRGNTRYASRPLRRRPAGPRSHRAVLSETGLRAAPPESGSLERQSDRQPGAQPGPAQRAAAGPPRVALLHPQAAGSEPDLQVVRYDRFHAFEPGEVGETTGSIARDSS